MINLIAWGIVYAALVLVPFALGMTVYYVGDSAEAGMLTIVGFYTLLITIAYQQKGAKSAKQR